MRFEVLVTPPRPAIQITPTARLYAACLLPARVHGPGVRSNCSVASTVSAATEAGPHLLAAPGGLRPHICREGLSAFFGLTADLRSHRGGRPVLPKGLCDHFQSGPKECLPTPAPQAGCGGDVQTQRPEGRHRCCTTSGTIPGVAPARP